MGLKARVATIVLVALAVVMVGAPTRAEAAPPVAPAPTKVDAGSNSTCALMSDATVRCWGSNIYGQLGDGTRVSRFQARTVGNLPPVKEIGVGKGHACALSIANRVYCWGHNRYGSVGGMVGDGTTTDRLYPVDVTPSGGTVKGITVGSTSSCAWTTNNKLFCWGLNFWGQLGVGDTAARYVPTLVKGLDYPILAVGIGGGDAGYESHATCVQFDGPAGVVDYRCTGYNHGNFGDGTKADSSTLKPVAELGSSPRVIAIGKQHACRLYAPASYIACTGVNAFGQLGNGTTIHSTSMIGVDGTYNRLSAGSDHTCGYDTLRAEYRCWGSNSWGQVGNSTTNHALRPTPVKGLTVPASDASISAGWTHTCATANDKNNVRRVYCWGSSSDGRLGSDHSPPLSPTPLVVQGI